MEVSVVYREKEYSYVKVGSAMTWVDDSQAIVPVMLHSILREQAISSGISSSVFLSDIPTPDEIKEEKEQKIKEKKISKVSKSKKSKLLSGFNPFQKGV